MRLYFIAIIPPLSISSKIDDIKLEFSAYNSHKALSSPSHITLRPPFFIHQQQEKDYFNSLQEFASKRDPFSIQLSGFGHFRQDVIYVQPLESSELTFLFTSLQVWLKEKLMLPHIPAYPIFHPHITVAYRDLTRGAFIRAWPLFEKREFEEIFTVGSICLLKKEEKKWKVIREFMFSRE